MTGAAVLLCAASAALLAAPGASAGSASHLSMSVTITGQGVAGDQCIWGVTFNVTITSSGHSPVTVTGVNFGGYATLFRNGGLVAGAVLAPGTSKFTNLASDDGPAVGQPCPAEAPAPLVLTVTTSGGTVTWNQSVSDPQVVTMMALPQGSTGAILAGSFDVAFQTGGSTPVPAGSVGVLGLAALAGCALFITQRWRRNRQSA